MSESSEIVKHLDGVAKVIEKNLQTYIPGARFEFTHDEFSIYKQSTEVQSGSIYPIVSYCLVKQEDYHAEMKDKSHLYVVASVQALGRKQIAQVPCTVYALGGELRLRVTSGANIVILDVDYYPDEEKSGIVSFPPWVKDWQELIGALILAATEAVLKLSGH